VIDGAWSGRRAKKWSISGRSSGFLTVFSRSWVVMWQLDDQFLEQCCLRPLPPGVDKLPEESIFVVRHDPDYRMRATFITLRDQRAGDGAGQMPWRSRRYPCSDEGESVAHACVLSH
jgi:hypothetical protein